MQLKKGESRILILCIDKKDASVIVSVALVYSVPLDMNLFWLFI